MNGRTPQERKEWRKINYGLLAMVVLLVGSALSPVVENVVGWVVVVVLVAAVVRLAWPYTVTEWRKDRALIREVGQWGDPNTPILLIAPDGTESIIGPNDETYPQARIERDRAQHAAQAPARRELGGE